MANSSRKTPEWFDQGPNGHKPEDFGIDLSDPDQRQEWINTTPISGIPTTPNDTGRSFDGARIDDVPGNDSGIASTIPVEPQGVTEDAVTDAFRHRRLHPAVHHEVQLFGVDPPKEV